jgi:hypothetical protein
MYFRHSGLPACADSTADRSGTFLYSPLTKGDSQIDSPLAKGVRGLLKKDSRRTSLAGMTAFLKDLVLYTNSTYRMQQHIPVQNYYGHSDNSILTIIENKLPPFP